MTGIIALDIDGTLTSTPHSLDSKISDWLYHLDRDGWKFIFITGRPFLWSIQTLKSLTFSYTLAVQNGALLLQMPSKKIIHRKYLSIDTLPKLELISREHETDFIIYSGFENQDWCYYRPHHLSRSLLSYMLERVKFLNEKWQSVQSFSDLPISLFSSIKFFAKENQAFSISEKLEELGLHAPPNKDPFNPEFFVIQGTHLEATKGNALREFIRIMKMTGPIIAAGDDHNDQSMLEVAHIKIVMEKAPIKLLEMADIIAPPAIQLGIIEGLQKALDLLNK